LNFLVTELSEVEKNVEQYKREHEITNVSAEANRYLEEASEYNRKSADYQTQLSVLESIENYLQDSDNKGGLVPSALNISDATLQSLIARFNELQMERLRLLRTTQESSPLVAAVDDQLDNLRTNILENLRNIKGSLEIR